MTSIPPTTKKPWLSDHARQFLRHSAGAVGIVSVPVALWWYMAHRQRQAVAHDVATRIRIPGVQTTDDILIEKCRPGDIVLFDRRWETCASGPWAALACIVAKTFLCQGDSDTTTSPRSVAQGNFDHVGIIVPGFVKAKPDEFDTSNLLLMEATPQGLVARSLKTRLERSQSRSVLLLQLNLPGERRDFDSTNYEDDDDDNDDNDKPLSSRELAVRRTRHYLNRELIKFRDKYLELSPKYHFSWMYSTLAIGGGMAYGLGWTRGIYWQGPVSPFAWFVLMALQQGAAAQNLNEQHERFQVKPEDFVRPSGTLDETNPLRLRPGWRFLAPIPLRERHR